MTTRVLAGIAGLVWLALAFALFFLMFLMAVMATPASLIFSAIFAAMGIAALTAAALLIVKPARRGILLASAVLGLLFTTIGSLACVRSSEGGALAGEPVLVFVILSAVATLASAASTRKVSTNTP